MGFIRYKIYSFLNFIWHGNSTDYYNLIPTKDQILAADSEQRSKRFAYPLCIGCYKRPANLFIIPCGHDVCFLCYVRLHFIHRSRVHDRDEASSKLIFKVKKLTCPTCFKRCFMIKTFADFNIEKNLETRKFYERARKHYEIIRNVNTDRQCRMCEDKINTLILPCFHNDLCYNCASRFINGETEMRIDMRDIQECGLFCYVCHKEGVACVKEPNLCWRIGDLLQKCLKELQNRSNARQDNVLYIFYVMIYIFYVMKKSMKKIIKQTKKVKKEKKEEKI